MKTNKRNLKLNLIGLFLFTIIVGLIFSSCEDEVAEPLPTEPTCDPIDGTLYKTKVYQTCGVEKSDGFYGTGTYNGFTLYNPTENLEAKPLILLAPGGAWERFTHLDSLGKMSMDLAQRGYAVATIEYELGEDNADTWIQSVKDQKSAIAYFKKNASIYNIDADKIFIGGWSTGAIISLHTAYTKDDEFSEISNETIRNMIKASVEKIGSEGVYFPEYTSDVRGVLVMMGWISDLSLIDTGEPALMLINHVDAHLINGTKIIDEFIDQNGFTFYGTRAICNWLGSELIFSGNQMKCITMSNSYSPGTEPNRFSLSSENYDAIADFFFNNI